MKLFGTHFLGLGLSLAAFSLASSATAQNEYAYSILPASAATWSGSTGTIVVPARQNGPSNQSTWGQFYGLADKAYKPLLKEVNINLGLFSGVVKSLAVRTKAGTMLVGNLTFDAETGEVKKSITNESDIVYLENIADGAKSVSILIRPDADVSSGFYFYATLADGSVEVVDNKGKTYNYSNMWMGHVPSKTYFSHVTVPGSHDSAANVSLSMAKTQASSIADQLAAGVRAFDLRPRYNADSESEIKLENLTIYHGGISTGVKFKDAMSSIVDFLKQNPSEAVVVRIQKENSELFGSLTDYSSTWRQSIRSWIESNKSYLLTKITSTLNLNACRGKIILFSNDPYGSDNSLEDFVYGGRLNWRNNPEQDKATIYYTFQSRVADATVEDKYDGVDTSKKIELTNANLDAAAADNTNRWYITYASLSGSPESYAKTINPAVNSHVKTLSGRLGLVYSDFSTTNGKDLTNSLVAHNQKHVKAKLTTSTTYTDHTVRVISLNTNQGTVSVQGTLDGHAAHGENILLTATPRDGYTFTSWSDGNTENPRTLNVIGNVNLTASFQKVDGINPLTTSPLGGECPNDEACTYDLQGRPHLAAHSGGAQVVISSGNKTIIR